MIVIGMNVSSVVSVGGVEESVEDVFCSGELVMGV